MATWLYAKAGRRPGAGNVKSPYLWICDPIDGTTNFTHSYPPFAVSVGVLENGVPVAAAVVEFAGACSLCSTSSCVCCRTHPFAARMEPDPDQTV